MSKRGENIYQRKDGRWEGRYAVGYYEDGRRKYRSVYDRSYRGVKDKLEAHKSKQMTLHTGRCKLTVKNSVTCGSIANRAKLSPHPIFVMNICSAPISCPS